MWSSTKQSLVALSPNEAEIIACNETLRNVLYIKNMIIEMFKRNLNTVIYTDNKGVIEFAKDGIHQRTKHLDIRVKHLYDCYQKNIFEIKKVISRKNQADMLTKFLTNGKFKKLILKSNLYSLGNKCLD